MVYVAFVVDDLAVYRRSVDWCRFQSWWSTVRRGWRRRARPLADNDLFPLPVAAASSFALIAANDDFIVVPMLSATSAYSRALAFMGNWAT
jgi:hypothetical protein